MHTVTQPHGTDGVPSGAPAAPVARVAVAGATGFTGQELLRLLSRHPAVALTSAMSSGQAAGSSRPLPGLARLWNGTIVPLAPQRSEERRVGKGGGSRWWPDVWEERDEADG